MRFEFVSAPSDVVVCIHVDVHAVAHGEVVLAPADDENHCGLVHMLLAEVILLVPTILGYDNAQPTTTSDAVAISRQKDCFRAGNVSG